LPDLDRPEYRDWMPGAKPLVGGPNQRHDVLWVGGMFSADLKMARQGVSDFTRLHAVADPAAAVLDPPAVFRDRSPAVILLASSCPGQWTTADALRLSIRWPLAAVVSVAATIVEGRRRSGPPLAGIEEVAWHDLPGRLAVWLADRDAGRPGTLGQPATARREERIIEAMRPRWQAGTGRHPPGPEVFVAAARPAVVEGLADLVSATGANVLSHAAGRPPLDVGSDLIVWDVDRIDGPVLAWLRLLVASAAGRRIIVLESFPRAETTAAAIQAGAAAVLGLPASVETLAGSLWRLARAE